MEKGTGISLGIHFTHRTGLVTQISMALCPERMGFLRTRAIQFKLPLLVKSFLRNPNYVDNPLKA
jgi:hypothetical protein